jgi:glutaredoxin
MSLWGSKKPDVKTASVSNGSTTGLTIGVAVLVFLLLLFVVGGIWCTCTESGKATFANIKSKLPGIGGGDLRELDVVMFMKPTCPWCKKMMEVLDSSGQLKNITVVDMSKPEGVAMAQQFGADKQPVPSFISRKNKVGTIGYRDSVTKLIEALKQPTGAPGPGHINLPGKPQQPQGNSEEPGMPPMPGQIDINLIKSLQIVLFARDGCGWCTKAKESCDQAGVMDVIQIVDITTPEGQSMAGQMLPPGTSGVPAWVSMATKKHVVGFKPFDQIVQELYSGNVPNEMA